MKVVTIYQTNARVPVDHKYVAIAAMHRAGTFPEAGTLVCSASRPGTVDTLIEMVQAPAVFPAEAGPLEAHVLWTVYPHSPIYFEPVLGYVQIESGRSDDAFAYIWSLATRGPFGSVSRTALSLVVTP